MYDIYRNSCEYEEEGWRRYEEEEEKKEELENSVAILAEDSIDTEQTEPT